MIGSRLDIITIHEFDDGYDDDEWTTAWNKCINLRELYVHHCTAESVKTIFATRKESLTVVSLSFDPSTDEEDVKKAMGYCAKGTK